MDKDEPSRKVFVDIGIHGRRWCQFAIIDFYCILSTFKVSFPILITFLFNKGKFTHPYIRSVFLLLQSENCLLLCTWTNNTLNSTPNHPVANEQSNLNKTINQILKCESFFGWRFFSSKFSHFHLPSDEKDCMQFQFRSHLQLK